MQWKVVSLYAEDSPLVWTQVSPQYSRRQLSNDGFPTGSSGSLPVAETMDKIWSASRCSESEVDYGVLSRPTCYRLTARI